MAGNEVGTGYVPIKPDTKGFGKQLEDGVKREGAPAARRSGDQVARVMRGAFLGGVALIGKGVFDFGGFEKSMNEVFTLLPGISAPAMDAMSEQVKDFATDFKVLPAEVVPALYQSLSAGVPSGNVFDFLDTATKLSKGGVTDLTTAVDGLSSVVNAYGPDVLSAEKASDLLFTTVKLGKTTIAELSSSIFNVTPTAAGLGVAFGDVTAALAAMTLQGVPTSVATTQLRQLFVELSKEGSAAAGVFTELSGKTFRDFIAGGGNVQEALQIMEKGAADAGVSISDMFGSVEAGSAALALTGGGTEAFSNALAGMQDSAGATDAAFATMNKGMAATLDGLKAKFSVVLLDLGKSMAPSVAVIGGFLLQLLDLFSALPGPMQTVIVLLGTVTAGLFAFSKPILNGIQLFGKLNGVFKLLAANPWVIVLAGLVTVAVLVIKNWSKVKAVLSGVWEWMKSAAKSVAGFFVDVWRTAVRIFTGIFESIGQFFREWWPLLLGIFTGGIGLIVGLVIDNWDQIYATVTGVMSSIVNFASSAWNSVWSIVSGIGGAIVNFITAIPSTIASAFETLADVITAPFRTAFGAIKSVWNATVGGFGFKTPSWIPFVGGKSFTIPKMSAGGVLDGPQLFLGGEYPGAKKNPEIVAPQSIIRDTVGQAIADNRGGAAPLQISLTMNVTADVRDRSFFDQQAVAMTRVIVRELERAGLARGTVTPSRSY